MWVTLFDFFQMQYNCFLGMNINYPTFQICTDFSEIYLISCFFPHVQPSFIGIACHRTLQWTAVYVHLHTYYLSEYKERIIKNSSCKVCTVFYKRLKGMFTFYVYGSIYHLKVGIPLLLSKRRRFAKS